MKEADIRRLKEALLRRQLELHDLEQSSKDSEQPVALDQASVGRLSRMDAMQGQQMALENARRRKSELVRVGGALRRIESGKYGMCALCGEDIDVRRLDVAPTSTHCVACAESR